MNKDYKPCRVVCAYIEDSEYFKRKENEVAKEYIMFLNKLSKYSVSLGSFAKTLNNGMNYELFVDKMPEDIIKLRKNSINRAYVLRCKQIYGDILLSYIKFQRKFKSFFGINIYLSVFEADSLKEHCNKEYFFELNYNDVYLFNDNAKKINKLCRIKESKYTCDDYPIVWNHLVTEEICNLNLKTYDRLMKFIEKYRIDYKDIYFCYEYTEFFSIQEDVVDKYSSAFISKEDCMEFIRTNCAKLTQEFLDEFYTQFGIELHLTNHEKDGFGNQYDEIDGTFFCLNDKQILKLSLLGEDLRRYIDFKILDYSYYL